MESARKALFYIFVLIYCIACPLIILYSFGYIFQPDKQGFHHTGLIYLSSTPSEANVYLDKSRFKHKTPTSIRDLKQGDYLITVKLRGYRAWKKKITIEAGKAVAIEDILLIPQELRPITLNPHCSYADLIPLNDTNYFILKKGNRLGDWDIYDQKKDETRPLIPEGNVYKTFVVNHIYSQEQGSMLIIFGGSRWNKKYLLVNSNDKEHPLMEVTKLFSKHPKSITWPEENKEDVFAVYDDHVTRLNIKTLALYPRHIDQIKGFGASPNWLYTLSQDNTVTKMNFDKEDAALLLEDTHLGKNLFEQSRFYEIKPLEKNLLLFRGENGDLMTTIPPYLLAKKDIKGFEYNSSNHRLLFWTKNTIWIADFIFNDKEGVFLRNYVQTKKLYSQGANISQCFLVHQGTHILFKDRNNVFLARIGPDEDFPMEHLVQVKKDTSILYINKAGFLYYIDENSQAMAIEIVPKKPFFDTFIE